MKKSWVGFWLLIAVAGAFWQHHEYLNQGWFEDDYAFLKSARNGYYGTHPSSWLDWVAFWNPWRGWFYRPTFLSYWAIFHTLHLAQPAIMHGAGLVLHGLVVGSWGLLIYRLTHRVIVGIFVSLSFLFWPGKEEAIWWIASHSVLLATLFSLLTLHVWLSYRRAESLTRRRVCYAAALLFFWLACASKSDAISLIFAIPLLDYAAGYWKFEKKTLFSYLPLILLWVIYGFCEFNAARTYAGNDPYLSGMLQMSLERRLSFLPTAVQSSSLGFVPIRQPIFMLILGLGVFTFFRRQSTSGRSLGALCGFAIGWFAFAVTPVALAAGNHSGGSRFHYYPMLPISLAAVVLSIAAVDALGDEISNRSTLAKDAFDIRLDALAILLWVLPVWTRIWIAEPQMETLWTIYLFGGVLAAYLAWKRVLAWPLFLALLIMFAFHQFAMFTEAKNDAWWQFSGVALCALLHHRNAVFGALLALGLWQSPTLGLALVVGLTILNQLFLTRKIASFWGHLQTPTESFGKI